MAIEIENDAKFKFLFNIDVAKDDLCHFTPANQLFCCLEPKRGDIHF